MVVVLLLVVAAVALGVGWGTEEELYVQIALGASVVAGLVVLWRILGTPTNPVGAEAEGEDDPAAVDDAAADAAQGEGLAPVIPATSAADADHRAAADGVPDGPVALDSKTADSIDLSDGSRDLSDRSRDEVVFLPRRATFHAVDCSAVAGRPVARGSRADLEATGMTACRRCLSGTSV